MTDRTSKGKGPFEIQYDEAKGLFDIRIFQKHMLGTKLTARIGKQEAILVEAEQKKAVTMRGNMISGVWNMPRKRMRTGPSPAR